MINVIRTGLGKREGGRGEGETERIAVVDGNREKFALDFVIWNVFLCSDVGGFRLFFCVSKSVIINLFVCFLV